VQVEFEFESRHELWWVFDFYSYFIRDFYLRTKRCCIWI